MPLARHREMQALDAEYILSHAWSPIGGVNLSPRSDPLVVRGDAYPSGRRLRGISRDAKSPIVAPAAKAIIASA
jgi:hypothetical protein